MACLQTVSAIAKSSGSMGKARQVIPLSKRPGDYVFILIFSVFLFISWTIDIISGISTYCSLSSCIVAFGFIFNPVKVQSVVKEHQASPPRTARTRCGRRKSFMKPITAGATAVIPVYPLALFPPPRFLSLLLLYEVFCYNPMWMRVLAWVSPFIYAPFYVAAIYAFFHGTLFYLRKT